MKSTTRILERLTLEYLSVLKKTDPELRALEEQRKTLYAALCRDLQEDTELILRLNDLLDADASAAERREELLLSTGVCLGLELGAMDPLENCRPDPGNFSVLLPSE